ncbi:hypothetical protein RFI_19791 [Reticulomyxa filosa]|uniref:SAM domain-containing protein n=1 Tax=Reticulomyxa filosa TaxID=46433 RepID=X6MU75_RETFI|nr:hypothetical protein RFI_19791 [Reticulomyxa filosa]|eukprot:ETO17533.1 hypothetical protein RFI_19791 [Reticulomyxa filosa]
MLEQFEEWLRNTVKLPEYLPQFQNCTYNDIRMVTYIDEQTLISDVGMHKKPHRMVFLKKAAELKKELSAFEEWLKKIHCERYLSKFENIGVFTFVDLLHSIHSKDDLKDVCGSDVQAQFLLWSKIAKLSTVPSQSNLSTPVPSSQTTVETRFDNVLR